MGRLPAPVALRLRASRRTAAPWAALCLVASTAGCGDSSQGPSEAVLIDPPGSTELVVGDFLSLTATATKPMAVSWTTDDDRIATVVGGVVEALRPGAVIIAAELPGGAADFVSLTVIPRPGGYTAEEVDYFAEIAFGSEFGGAEPVLRRWPSGSGPLIRINGSPTDGDRAVVDSVLAEMNRLAPLDIELVTDFPTAELHFVPTSSFTSILPQAPPGNDGLVWLWWDADQTLVRSVILIASDRPVEVRAHLIREELTQMLGLLQDSFRYPESIFYQGFSTVTEYLPIDRVVVELLYREELAVGMRPLDAQRVARTLLRASPVALSVMAPSVDVDVAHRIRPSVSATLGSVATYRGPAGSAGSASSRRGVNRRRCLPRPGPIAGCH
jgi:hypothetical protein